MDTFYPRKKVTITVKNSMCSGKGEQGALCAPSDKNVITMFFCLKKMEGEKRKEEFSKLKIKKIFFTVFPI